MNAAPIVCVPALTGMRIAAPFSTCVLGEVREQDAPPVERDLELLGFSEVRAEHAAAALDQVGAHDVLGVDREMMRELSTAARAERHAGQVLVLREVARDEVFLLSRSGIAGSPIASRLILPAAAT